ncbi:M23 family metallopeptidase [Lewinella sp. IMCC34191]|uniref:M23 family metallopeptidase n=1 Tax=Lewinella sp. IMCC34191 TaxID=2259172 RepID=UPI001300A525|nr:M23 family metallopeptidase [Lewinella sp. IMCC34191]
MSSRRKISINGPDAAPLRTRSGRRLTVLVLLAVGISVAVWLLVRAASHEEQQPEVESKAEQGGGAQVKSPSRAATSDGVIRQDVTLSDLLAKFRVETEVTTAILAHPAVPPDLMVRSGTLYRVEYGSEPASPARVLTFERDDTTLLSLRFQPYAHVTAIPREVTVHEVRYAGIITEDFWVSILESDRLHHTLLPVVEEALKWTVDLFHLRPGDRYKLIYDEERRDGRPIGVKALKAVEIETPGQAYRVFGVGSVDAPAYVDYYGSSLRRQFLRAPVKFGIVSSRFNPQRRHPVTGEIRPHGGTDFAAPEGSPIIALAAGRVTRRAEDPFNGKYIEVSHDGRFSTMYLHMNSFGPDTEIGSRVEQGSVIGFVGSTGLSTGPHVCLRFRDRGVEKDFLQYRDEGVTAPGAGVSGHFVERRDSLLDILDSLDYQEINF